MSRTTLLKSRDVAVKVVSKCGNFRASVVNCPATFRETVARHDLVRRTFGHRGFLQLTGNNISFSNLLAATLDREERVESRFVSAEATSISEAMALGECRAHTSNNMEGAAVGALRVDRVLYNQAKPVTSATKLQWDDYATSHLNVPEDAFSEEHITQLQSDTLTTHAGNFFAKSDGIPTAVLLRCDIGLETCDEPTYKEWEVFYNAGALVQPIVDISGDANEAVKALQRGWLCSLCESHPAYEMWNHHVLRRALEDKCVMQDLLSLASGDYEGAWAVAEKCRQPTTPISSCAGALDGLRRIVRDPFGSLQKRQAGGSSATFLLDCESSTRTPVDFFCRCSKEQMLEALKSCTTEQLENAKGQPMTCRYCKRSVTFSEEEWSTLVNRSQ